MQVMDLMRVRNSAKQELSVVGSSDSSSAYRMIGAHPNNTFSSIREHDSITNEEGHAAFRSFFHFAHLARCAAAIFLLAAGDIVRAAIATIFGPLTFAQRAR